MIARAAALLTMAAVAGCAPAKPDRGMVLPAPTGFDCGFHWSIDYRRTREERESPPACALPDAATLAQSCAVYDMVRASDYRPDEEDETGEVRNPTPLPDYRVDSLACAFDGDGRNRATCRFALTVPGGTSAPTTVRLRHESWSRVTPLIFERGVAWQLDDDCTPAPPAP
jgi:hypothetical protein